MTINKTHSLPIWRDANRLLLLIEQAVKTFSRYHKYTATLLQVTQLRVSEFGYLKGGLKRRCNDQITFTHGDLSCV